MPQQRIWPCETCGRGTRGVRRTLDSCPFFWNHEGPPHRHPDGSPVCNWIGHRTCDRCWVEAVFDLGPVHPAWSEQAAPEEPYNRFPKLQVVKPQVDVAQKAKVIGVQS